MLAPTVCDSMKIFSIWYLCLQWTTSARWWTWTSVNCQLAARKSKVSECIHIIANDTLIIQFFMPNVSFKYSVQFSQWHQMWVTGRCETTTVKKICWCELWTHRKETSEDYWWRLIETQSQKVILKYLDFHLPMISLVFLFLFLT